MSILESTMSARKIQDLNSGEKDDLLNKIRELAPDAVSQVECQINGAKQPLSGLGSAGLRAPESQIFEGIPFAFQPGASGIDKFIDKVIDDYESRDIDIPQAIKENPRIEPYLPAINDIRDYAYASMKRFREARRAGEKFDYDEEILGYIKYIVRSGSNHRFLFVNSCEMLLDPKAAVKWLGDSLSDRDRAMFNMYYPMYVSMLKPMVDKAIIRNFKIYRRELLAYHITELNKGRNGA